jgi:hypothetical protein
VGGEDVGDLRSPQVSESDDSGDEPVRIGSDDELGFSHWPERLGSVVAVARRALDEDGLDHPVTAPRVGAEVGGHVRGPGTIPQVVMGVADRQVRLENIRHDAIMPFP